MQRAVILVRVVKPGGVGSSGTRNQATHLAMTYQSFGDASAGDDFFHSESLLIIRYRRSDLVAHSGRANQQQHAPVYLEFKNKRLTFQAWEVG